LLRGVSDISLTESFTGIGEPGKEIDTGNTTTGEEQKGGWNVEEWNMKENTAWLLHIEGGSTVDIAAGTMKGADSTAEMDTRGVKDVRV
jgi:hypothetical protein